METTLTAAQLIVLIVYFLGVYVYKYFVIRWEAPILREMIPAVNIIAGLVLGFFGLAGFNIAEAVLGTLAMGGVASVVGMPKKIIAAEAARKASN